MNILKRHFPDGWWTAVFLGPYTFGLIVFIVYPFAMSFANSFAELSLFGHSTYIGFVNYLELFRDSSFWKSIWITTYYVILLVPLELIVALLLASLVNQAFVGRNLFRAIFFMPFVLSLAAIGLVWTWLLSPDYGFVSQFLQWFGVSQPSWLTEPSLVMLALVIASVWRNSGYYMVIFLAGMQNIPQDLYEASRIDGANRWQQYRYVTWPMLTPTTFLSVIIGVILGFQVFDLSFIMTQGGPAKSTYTLLYFIYSHGFEKGNLGYASASAVIMAIILLAFTAIYFKMQRHWVHYESK